MVVLGVTSRLTAVARSTGLFSPNIAVLQTLPSTNSQQQIRCIKKHFNPKWRRQRREKYLKAPLADYDALRQVMSQNMTPAEIRAFMRQRGMVPFASASPLISIGDSGTIFDDYIPKNAVGVQSSIAEKFTEQKKKITKMKATRELKKYDDTFDAKIFAEEAQSIYVESHDLLTRVFPRNFKSEYGNQDDYYRLLDLVTEFGWTQMTEGLGNKTLSWKFVESLEPAMVLNTAAFESKKSNNSYAQITVRFHSRQIMALYDRFGRLMHGSETVPKDNIDYIVFEKHITDTEGKWRIHGKIRPSWEDESSANRVVRRTMEITELSESKTKQSENNELEAVN